MVRPLFRDYLIAHPETKRACADLKQNCASQYQSDREAYTNFKTTFIRDINLKAVRPQLHFKPLAETDFPLLLKWLKEAHVKAWWDQGIIWTSELVSKKYALKRPVHAYIILINEAPIGYIQFYDVKDFADVDRPQWHQSAAGLDYYIGEPGFLKKGFAPIILQKFLVEQVKPLFAHCLVDPDVKNIAAIRAYEKAGFKAIDTPSQNICWMLAELSHSIALFSCFCRDDSKSGNLAAIVQGFVGDDSAKQAFAAELNLPVTVFIEDVQAEIATLQFFYPTSESVLCLHGTLAAGKYLMHLRDIDALGVKIQSGQILKMMKQADPIQVLMPVAEILPVNVDVTTIAKMLHIDTDQLDPSLPCVAASLGSPKLLMPVKTAAILNHLKPDFDFIKKWSVEHQVNGLYVYSADTPPGVDFIARGFNPKGGWNEDAATGVAAGTLISVLPRPPKKDFVIDQGDAMGVPSRIYVSLAEDGQVLVGGEIHVVGAL